MLNLNLIEPERFAQKALGYASKAFASEFDDWLPAEPWTGCERSLVDLAISPAYAGALALQVLNVSISQFQMPCKD